MITGNHDDRIDQLLEELGPAEPPADLVSTVMARVAADGPADADRRVSMNKPGVTPMNKKVMWGVAAVAAVTLAVSYSLGFPPVWEGTEGTVGAAKRYQAQQIANKDVAVGTTPVQEFFQSELFDRLIKDEASRKLLTDAATRRTLASLDLAELFADSNIRETLLDNDVHAAFADLDIRAELKLGIEAAALHADAAGKLVGKSKLVAEILADPNLVQSLQNDAVWTALSSLEMRDLFENDLFAAALHSDAFVNAVKVPLFEQAIRSELFDTALKNKISDQ